jgi:hypothetical protein
MSPALLPGKRCPTRVLADMIRIFVSLGKAGPLLKRSIGYVRQKNTCRIRLLRNWDGKPKSADFRPVFEPLLANICSSFKNFYNSVKFVKFVSGIAFFAIPFTARKRAAIDGCDSSPENFENLQSTL